MSADNLYLEILSTGPTQLEKTLHMVMHLSGLSPDTKLTHYAIVKVSSNQLHEFSSHANLALADDAQDTLVLFYTPQEGTQPLPWPIAIKDISSFVSSWLAQAEAPHDDHLFDGSTSTGGWLVATPRYGRLAGFREPVFCVQNKLLYYPK